MNKTAWHRHTLKNKVWYEFHVTELDEKGQCIVSTKTKIARVRSQGLAYSLWQKLQEVYPDNKFSLEIS